MSLFSVEWKSQNSPASRRKSNDQEPVHSTLKPNGKGHKKTSREPSNDIMALFVLRKFILQTRMRSHPVEVDVWFFGRALRLLPYFMCENSEGSGEPARMRRLAWAFAGRLCDKYHNLMSWLKYKTTQAES